MLERIDEIDTSAIEELGRIKRDQEVLEGRLELMQERRDGVSEVVFERVRGDYRRRHETLEEEARPLKEAARQEFAKLQALLHDIQQGRDDARLAKEELEFRNALGEFEGDDFEQQAQEAAERLDQRESELAAVEALRERFFAAVRSAEELERQEGGELPPPVLPHAAAADAEGAPGMPAQPVPLAAAESDAGTDEGEGEDELAGALEDDGTDVEGNRWAPPVPPPVPAALHAGEGEPLSSGRFGDTPAALAEVGEPVTATTMTDGDSGVDDLELSREAGPGEGVLDTEATSLMDTTGAVMGEAAAGGEPAADDEGWHEAATGSFEVPPLPPVPEGGEAAAAEPFDDDLGGATRILSRPRLVESGDAGGPREHLLALGRTSIGRASDNIVHLLDEAVSRHHAEIVPGPDGFLVRDLGSENGIYVNGDRLPEHVLRDGDVIQIGARTLVYKGA